MRFSQRRTGPPRHRLHVAARWMCAMGVMYGGVCAASSATSPDDLCGATIVQDLKLDRDVICVGDGLVVGADGIRIDLNGYTLSGSGTGIGVVVTERHEVSIGGGTIHNFAVGMRVISSTEIEIKHMEFLGNREGIDFQAGSVDNIVKENIFRDSSVRAIMLRGSTSDNDIKNNTFINDRVGILIFGGVDNTVKENEVSGSSVAGIRLNVLATGNVIKDNVVSSSLAGIEFLVTPTGSAQGNELKDNRLWANTCGLKGPTEGNTLKDNVFEGNSADTCS